MKRNINFLRVQHRTHDSGFARRLKYNSLKLCVAEVEQVLSDYLKTEINV